MDSDFKVPVTSGNNSDGVSGQNLNENSSSADVNNSVPIPLSPLSGQEVSGTNNVHHPSNKHHKPSSTFESQSSGVMPSSYNISTNKEPKGLVIPYLASLIAGTVLMVAAFYSVLGLITYVIEHTLNKSNNSESVIGYISSFDHFIALSSVALFLVSLPVSMVMFLLVRKYEKRDDWRIKQKTRKMVYVVASVILILGIIGSLSTMIYSILSTSLDTNMIGSYSSIYEDANVAKIDKTKAITSSVIEGLSALVILGFALFTLGNEYVSKIRKMLWFVFLGVAIIGLTLTVVALMKVKSFASESKSKNSSKTTSQNSKTDFQYDYPASASNSSIGSGNSSSSSSALKTELEFVKDDLEYYKEKNSFYPTQAQWKDGSLKTEYLLSSQSTLDKITYNPSGCEGKGCKSFELTAKDSTGKTVSVKSE